MLQVELPVQALEPVDQGDISRLGSLPPFRSRRGSRVLLDRERQELTLGQPAQRPSHPRIEEPEDGPEHTIRSERVASVNPEYALIQAEHYGAIRMGHDPVNVAESEYGQAIPQQQVWLLHRCPAVPLATFPTSPLTRLTHSP